MDKKKETAIKQIRSHVAEMAELVLEQLRELDNMLNYDELAPSSENQYDFKDKEKKIDKFEVTIDEEFIDLICLHKPVASELRNIIACYRISINLERVGDIVINIYNMLLDTEPKRVIRKYLNDMAHMLSMANNMVEKSLLSFFNDDVEYAVWTLKNDDVIDEVNRKMIQKIVKRNFQDFKDPKSINNFFNMYSIVSSIERIADHATNIAEASIYYQRGHDVRHSKMGKIESALGINKEEK